MLMQSGRACVGAFVATVCALLLVAGCGSSGSSTHGSRATGETHPGSQSLSAKSERNPIAKFGHEASAAEREKVGALITRSLEARAAADFASQCQTLNMAAIENIPGAKNRRDCAAALKRFASPLAGTKKVRANTLSGPIVELRIQGNRGYVLYHGNDGKDYYVPVEKEDGAWKLGSILTLTL